MRRGGGAFEPWLSARALEELFVDDELYTAWSSGRLNLSAIARGLDRRGPGAPA
jgi:hypothetical protein